MKTGKMGKEGDYKLGKRKVEESDGAEELPARGHCGDEKTPPLWHQCLESDPNGNGYPDEVHRLWTQCSFTAFQIRKTDEKDIVIGGAAAILIGISVRACLNNS